MSKTIVYIGGFELPDKNAASHRVLNNAKLFQELGYKVVFIGVDKAIQSDTDILKTKSETQGFETYAIPYPKRGKSWFRFLTDVRAYIQVIEECNDVEMLILYNFQAIAMKKLMNYCHRNSIKCCADITEWRSAKGENLVYRVLKDSDTWYRMTRLHKQMDGLIVISSYLQAYYSYCRKTALVPTLVDISEEKWGNPYEKSKDVLRLVYAGNPGKKDKLDVLVKALQSVKRAFCLDVIGMTEEQFLHYYPDCKDLLSSRIIFHGRISHNETLKFVKNANYSCFFRDDDRVSNAGFPTKLAEAFSCGTPVLTNETSDIADYVKHLQNGLLLRNLDIKTITKEIELAPPLLKVDNSIFDYHNYQNALHGFLKRLENK